MTALDCYDVLHYGQALLEKLEAVKAEIDQKQGLLDEKTWISQAVSRMQVALKGSVQVLPKAVALPELEVARAHHAQRQQALVVECLERLEAGITFHGGSRSPLKETLFSTFKLAQLLKVGPDEFEKRCQEFEKKLQASYSKRMLAEPVFVPLQSVVAMLSDAVSQWRQSREVPEISMEERQALLDELDAAARALEVPIRQSKLLAEVACLPVKELFETSGVAQKPKKRSPKITLQEVEQASENAVADDAVTPEGPTSQAASVPLEASAPIVQKRKKK
jgi:hypothetical protein